MPENKPSPKRIIFLYPDPPGFSGQRQAAELVLKTIQRDPSFKCYPIKLPGAPKTGSKLIGVFRFAIQSCMSLMKLCWLSAFASISAVFIAISQTDRTLDREKKLVSLIRFLSRRPSLKMACRLDSSLFMTWQDDDATAEKFRNFLRSCELVTALGPGQQGFLENRYKLSPQQLQVVPNACEVVCCSQEQITKKHQSSETVRVLHLSSLMEPKGYVELVEAFRSIPSNIHLALCGKVTETCYDRRFQNVNEAEAFLKNAERYFPNLQWIRGAHGQEKEQLFQASDIFVLPTWYPVESQPLVLLEAMASGCAIVCTDIGEIPFMLDESNAVILPQPTSESIAEAVTTLAQDAEKRRALAIAARARLLDRFSIASFNSTWTELFHKVYG